MPHAIWKFSIEIADRQLITMPAGATVLTVQAQYGTPCIWARVDTQAPTEQRAFAVFGTDHTMPADLSTYVYVGTFLIHGGELVFHLYEVVDGAF